jgi:hypothetical protein
MLTDEQKDIRLYYSLAVYHGLHWPAREVEDTSLIPQPRTISCVFYKKRSQAGRKIHIKKSIHHRLFNRIELAFSRFPLFPSSIRHSRDMCVSRLSIEVGVYKGTKNTHELIPQIMYETITTTKMRLVLNSR